MASSRPRNDLGLLYYSHRDSFIITSIIVGFNASVNHIINYDSGSESDSDIEEI